MARAACSSSFAAFLFFSGFIRQNINLLAISLLVAFLYGSMVWGIFPYKPDMSWESHLMGLMTGLGLALYYRNEGPVIQKHVWEEEEEAEADADAEAGAEVDAEGKAAGDEGQEGEGKR